MKKLVFLGACLLALASHPVKAQAGGPEVVVVRVSEAGLSSRLIIIRGEGKSEQVELDNGLSAKNLTASGVAMQQVFAKLYQEGYALKSTFGGAGAYTATLVFVKEK